MVGVPVPGALLIRQFDLASLGLSAGVVGLVFVFLSVGEPVAAGLFTLLFERQGMFLRVVAFT